ncbi:hypothetical protein LPJ73_000822 [Coemansia sp. RSA 2703]|nr:hypothetical protein LPJ73_000822 [Coemansia sp. RSA 2703]KAJ2397445.1 hypothetical protein GGI05_000639 [Coemansia sp. RSA 2603]
MAVTLLQSPPTLTAVVLTCPDTSVACDPPAASLPSELCGALHLDAHNLVFFSDAELKGFSIPYQNIVIHALSNEDAHLYCQLDGPFPGSDSTNGAESDTEQEEFAELRFYPKDKTMCGIDVVDRLFATMSECAAMNPDEDAQDLSEDEQNDDDGENSNTDDPAIQSLDDFNPDDFITSKAQLDSLTPAGRLIYERLESTIDIPEPDSETTHNATTAISEKESV